MVITAAAILPAGSLGFSALAALGAELSATQSGVGANPTPPGAIPIIR
ncbi:hypothetical protein [Sphingomonas sp.]